MNEIIVLLLVLAIFLLAWLAWREFSSSKNAALLSQLEDKHRAMLIDLNDGLTKLGDRMNIASQGSADLLKNAVTQELQQTRDAMHGSKLAQTENLAKNREELLEKLNQTFESLSKTVEDRLDLISGKVSERLDEGFKKTNETFVSVMERLATIDEAQKKIDGLTVNMVSLQELLGDKRSRGAYGEVQLEGLVRNVLPNDSYKMQYTFSNGSRVDCALFLPEPTGTVAVDSKFPLENYHKMFDNTLSEALQNAAEKQFKLDIKRHVDDIASKYIIPNVTSDGAVMFIPAEAVFAEIHAYHPEIIDYAMNKRVWLVSPTTLMAVLNTARAVLKDVEMRKQVHIIKDELGRLSKDFERFDVRMKKLADNIRQAHDNAQEVHISSQKITNRFKQIERVELSNTPVDLLDIVDDVEDKLE
ncbi:MAG: DNA recombination protein RmuC [Methylotenera sp.]